jgi:hypothetical protein
MNPLDHAEDDQPAVTLEELAEFPATGPAALLRQSLAMEALEDRIWLAMGRPAPGRTPLESLPVVPPYVEPRLRAARRRRRIPHVVTGMFVGMLWSCIAFVNPASGWLYDSMRVDPTIGAGAAFAPGMIVGAVWGYAMRKQNSRWLALTGLTAAGTAIAPWGPLLTGAVVVVAIVLLHHRARRQVVDITPVAPSLQSSAQLADLTKTPIETADPLRERADELGLACTDIDAVDIVDLVAATIAADAWLIATGASRFEQAASLGGRSLGALAALYARAAGQGEAVLGPLPGAEPWPMTVRALHARIPALRTWAHEYLGAEASTVAFQRAASDLAWGGGGDDRCGRVARYLWKHAA